MQPNQVPRFDPEKPAKYIYDGGITDARRCLFLPCIILMMQRVFRVRMQSVNTPKMSQVFSKYRERSYFLGS
jgi:hypothetical protein